MTNDSSPRHAAPEPNEFDHAAAGTTSHVESTAVAGVAVKAAGEARGAHNGGRGRHSREVERDLEPAAHAVNLVKTYGSDDTMVKALDDVSVEFAKHEFTAIMGPSGSGKSTLMHCMAGLDSATGGHAYIGDTDLTNLKDKQLTQLRRDCLGFIFQSFNLVPTLTARENITLPTDIAGKKVDADWFDEVTDRLGLSNRLTHRPSELSGGQQQRVACARALVSRPDIIFGDEPTGNLDSNSSAEVLDILRTAVDKDNQTVVIVTHDPRAASYSDRVVFLADGKIVDELRNPSVDEILKTMTSIEDY